MSRKTVKGGIMDKKQIFKPTDPNLDLLKVLKNIDYYHDVAIAVENGYGKQLYIKMFSIVVLDDDAVRQMFFVTIPSEDGNPDKEKLEIFRMTADGEDLGLIIEEDLDVKMKVLSECLKDFDDEDDDGDDNDYDADDLDEQDDDDIEEVDSDECGKAESNDDKSQVDLLDRFLNPNDTDPIVILDKYGREMRFEQVAVIPHEKNGKKELYVLLKPLDKIQGIKDDEMILFVTDTDANGKTVIRVEEDIKIWREVYKKYLELLKRNS